MKRFLIMVLAIATGFQAKAELFSRESLTGGAIGAIAGAVIGHNNGGRSGEGAAIGAGVGLLAGSLVNDRNRHHGHSGGYYSSPGYSHVSVGYSSSRYYPSHRYHRGHSHWGPSFSVGYGSSYRPSYYAPRYYAQPYYTPVIATPVYSQPVIVQQPVVQQSAPAPAPSQVTIINNYYGSSSPMSSANSMFGR